MAQYALKAAALSVLLVFASMTILSPLAMAQGGAMAQGALGQGAMAQGAQTPAPTTKAAPPPEEAPTSLADALTGPAKTEYEAAVVLFEDGDFAGALLKFQAAHQASGDPRLLWNIAACHKQQRHYARMLPLVEAYLAQAGNLATEAERAHARTVLDTLQPFVGRIQVFVDQAGATVYVDEEVLGTTPLPLQRIDMGPRRLRIAKPEFVEWAQLVTVQGGETLVINAQLLPVRHVGVLHVDTDVAGDIRVDGMLVGRGQWRGELPSGTHTVEVRAPGMQVYVGDAAVLDNQTNTMRVNLRPLPLVERDQKSGPKGLWLWVAGGALAAAGLGLGAYALFRPSDPGTAPTVPGTMEPGVINLP